MSTGGTTPSFGGLYRSLLISVVLPLALVLILQHRFAMPLITALAISAVFPLGEIVWTWTQRRRLEPLGAMMLVIIAGGIVMSLVSGDVHFALVKESLGTFMVALFFLGSLLGRRPMIFLLGRQFSTRGDPVRVAAWDARWEFPAFRRAMRLMTAVWGCGYLVDAIARAVAAYTLPPNVVVVLSPVSMIGMTALLVVFTLSYARRAQRNARTSAP